MNIGPVYQEQWYQKCDLIMSSLANLPYCGGERWGDLILSSQSNLKSIFFLSKIQNSHKRCNILMIFFSLPGLVAYQYQYQYEYAPLKEVMPYIYYQIIPIL